MKGTNILASLNYFSIFFAPLLFPIIVYFLAEGDVKYHAKKALSIHLIPYVILIIGFILFGIIGISFQSNTAAGLGLVATFCISAVVGIYYFIWNIVKGINVLKGN